MIDTMDAYGEGRTRKIEACHTADATFVRRREHERREDLKDHRSGTWIISRAALLFLARRRITSRCYQKLFTCKLVIYSSTRSFQPAMVFVVVTAAVVA
jgi:cobalamin synthase